MAPRKKTEKPQTSSGGCDKDGTRRYVKAPARHGRMAQQRSKTYCTDTSSLSDLTSNKETSESEHGSLRRSRRQTSQTQTSTRSSQSSDGKENEVSSEGRTNSKPQRSTRRKKPGSTTSRSSRLADLSSLIDKELSYSEKGLMESEYKLPKHGSGEASCTENEGESPVNLTSTESDSDQLGTAEPFSPGKNSRSNNIEKDDGRRASPGLSSWFQSSQAGDRHRLGVVPGESFNSVKRVPFDEVPFDKKTNTQTPVTVRCRDILKSTAHISTPCSEPSTEEEYLFGFENLLNYNEPTLNLSSRLSPISEKDSKRSRRTRKNKHAEILTASQKDCEPWKGLLEYSTSKLYENKPRRRAKTKTLKTRNAEKEDNTREHNLSELHLFDVTNDELIVRKEEIPVYESEEEEFEKRKKKRPESRKPYPAARKDELLPWDEIMAHELVIESV